VGGLIFFDYYQSKRRTIYAGWFSFVEVGDGYKYGERKG
jgi:hypothetical protein